MSEKAKKSELEDLIEYLHYHPQASKFVPAVLKAWEENKNRIENLDLDGDRFLTQICQILSQELVIKEKRLEKILNLSKQELRSRFNYLIRKYPNSFSIDYFDENDWIIFITKEGLISA